MTFNRNEMRYRPEQFTNKLNDQLRQQEAKESSDWKYSADGTQVIVIGMQPPPSPPGAFGIVLYDIAGDRLTINTVLM